MTFRAFALSTCLAVIPASVMAGPFADAEMALRDAYGQYRAALFQSNAGNAEATGKAMQALGEKWGALELAWKDGAPPQYADDPALGETLTGVDQDIAEAAGMVSSGNLADAHLALEKVREKIGDLHMRNGIVTFSDRMNAYHAKMEEVLDRGAPGPDGMTTLVEDAAVLAFLAEDIVAHPAPESSDPAYSGLVDGFMKSVSALQSAVRAGDPDAAKAAIGNLKVPYSKLFAKFG
jgi:hypothetical protein